MFGDAQVEAASALRQKKTDYDFLTYNGRITFETFMAAIEKNARGLDHDGPHYII